MPWYSLQDIHMFISLLTSLSKRRRSMKTSMMKLMMGRMSTVRMLRSIATPATMTPTTATMSMMAEIAKMTTRMIQMTLSRVSCFPSLILPETARMMRPRMIEMMSAPMAPHAPLVSMLYQRLKMARMISDRPASLTN